MRARSGQYSGAAKWLHWLVVFFLGSLMSAAFSFKWIPPEDRGAAIPVHVAIGLIVLGLTIVRLAVRAVTPPPALPDATPGWMRSGSKIGHFLIYALFFYLAVLGLWMAAMSPVDIRLFSDLNVSALAPANPELLAALRPWHFAGSVLFGLVLIGHVGAALWHHLIVKDDVLLRILPFTGLARRILDEGRPPSWRFPSSNKIDWGDRRTWFVDRNRS